MDQQTIEAYDRASADFADEWLTQPPPDDLYEFLSRFFRPGPTADVGCGGGRDCAWLSQQGFRPTGYDAADGLLSEARRRYPELSFEKATLPELKEIHRRFTNVLCETVLMHLSPGLVRAASRRLVELLEPDGTLYLSWRVSSGDRRDGQGRLYSSFATSEVMSGLSDLSVLFDEETTSRSSGRVIHRVIARKSL